MTPHWTQLLLVSAVVVAFIVLIVLLFFGRDRKLDSRLESFTDRRRPGSGARDGRSDRKGSSADRRRPGTAAPAPRSNLIQMGMILVPTNAAELTKLRARLLHAGFYQNRAMHVFLGVKLILLLAGTAVGLVLTLAGVLPPMRALPASLGLFFIGMFGPSFWLNMRKSKRQTLLRRGLPDVLDVMIICLEGGLSLQSSLKRVTDELRETHPQLGEELRIVDREIQLGVVTGEAIRHFAERTDLEEVASLSSVIAQSERFGASLVKSIRSHSESMRSKRKQNAEERAQKASTKMLIPTLLFIFPAVFIILLAPAAFEVQAIFSAGQP